MVTADLFDKFHVDQTKVQDACYAFTNPSPSFTKPPSATTSPATPKPCDIVADFKKGIKSDPASFPTLKDDKQWNQWHTSFVAIAHAQDVDDALDPAFKPPSGAPTELF